MGRIRTVKPEFFTSEDIVALSPFARLLYIAIWCEADREGRLVWKPKTFKMRYLPADQVDVDQLCEELVGSGLVVPYGDGLAHIPTFLDHQHINPRETQSRLPDPDASITREQRVSTRANQELHAQGGRERKGTLYDASKFDAFWVDYPKKVAKPAAEKAWKKAGINGEFSDVMDALTKQKKSEGWVKDGGKYIPNPATWINQRRWEDEVAGSHAGASTDEFAGAI